MAGPTKEQLLLQVDASVELLRREMEKGGGVVDKFDREARRTLDRFDGRMSKVGSRGMPELQKNLAGVRASLTGLVAGLATIGTGAAARTFLDLADQSKLLRAQLQLATAEFGTFGQGQADVERIAAGTRIGLEASTKLYGNLLRASQPLGKSQGDAARATETFAKALKIGGAGAAEAASATLQFSQALASGVLRGDEFNSIAEASPRILKLLADSMGVPQGRLRALAAEGKLTSDKLYEALTNTKVTSGIDAEFAQLPITFEESMTLVHDAAVTAFGAFDRGGQFSDAIVSFVGTGADGFQNLAERAEASGIEIRATFAGLGDVFEPLLSGANSVFDGVDSRANYTRDTIANLLGYFDKIQNLDIGFDRAYTRFGRSMLMKDTTEADLPQWSDRRGTFLRRFNGETNSRQGLSAARAAEDRIPASLKIRTGELQDYLTGAGRFSPRPAATPAASPSKGRSGASAERSAAAAAKRAEREEARAKAEQERNDRRYAGLLAQEQSDELRARAALTTNVGDRLRLEQEQRDAALASRLQEIQDDKALSVARKAELSAAVRRVADLDKQRADRDARADAVARDLETARASLDRNLATLGIEADLALTARDRRAVELRILAAQEELERRVQQAILDNPNSTPEAIAGATAELASIGERHSGRVEQVNRQTASPLEQYRNEVLATTSDMNAALEGVTVNGLKGLEDGLVGIITGTQSVGEAFNNLATSVVADLARVIVQQLVMKSLMQSFGGPFGALFGFAKGGVVPEPPAYAGGGIIIGPGTGTSDDILARVSTGEGILTAEAVRHYGVDAVAALNEKRVPRFASGGVVGSPGVRMLRFPALPDPAKLRAPAIPDLSKLGAGRRDTVDHRVRVDVKPSPLFEAQVEQATVRTVGAAAEPIMRGAEQRTRAGLARPGLPGGLG